MVRLLIGASGAKLAFVDSMAAVRSPPSDMVTVRLTGSGTNVTVTVTFCAGIVNL